MIFPSRVEIVVSACFAQISFVVTALGRLPGPIIVSYAIFEWPVRCHLFDVTGDLGCSGGIMSVTRRLLRGTVQPALLGTLSENACWSPPMLSRLSTHTLPTPKFWAVFGDFRLLSLLRVGVPGPTPLRRPTKRDKRPTRSQAH